MGAAVVVFGAVVVVLLTGAASDVLGTTIEGFTSRGLVGGCIDGFAATVMVFATAVSVLGVGVLVLGVTVESVVGAAGETDGVELATTTPAHR